MPDKKVTKAPLKRIGSDQTTLQIKGVKPFITNFDDFCIWATILIDDLYKPLKPLFNHSGPQSQCSDRELITFAIIGECKGWNQENELVSEWHNYRHLFPFLPERSRFNRRRRNLMSAINSIRQAILQHASPLLNQFQPENCCKIGSMISVFAINILDLVQDNQGAIDRQPLPIIEFKKAYYAPSRSYWKSYGARYGKVPSKKQTIFGYKLQLLVTLNGVILDFELTGANQADLSVGMELLEAYCQLKVIGDKAYISHPLQLRLSKDRQLVLLTNPRRYQKEAEKPERSRLLNHFRQIIETVNGQLVGQFNIEINFANSFWGLCARLNTKLAGHSLSIYLIENQDFLKIKALSFPNWHNPLNNTLSPLNFMVIQPIGKNNTISFQIAKNKT